MTHSVLLQPQDAPPAHLSEVLQAVSTPACAAACQALSARQYKARP